ncbi:MAG TPA: hypothetical protein PLU26_15685 [Candidatus Competibacter sp.]|nr:hypothetical protein [Candidatus Competibacteraceae bacterium]HAO32164.1 hypothetical protein [Candidatus Competibacteraceae bacterium]HUM95892.1 hypothetical protein [Candidatus Competibacter sp.]
MAQALTSEILKRTSRAFAGTYGTSEENRSLGFTPGFRDEETGAVYLSCWSDGSPAPFHALDGLPDHLILARGPNGRVAAVKASIVAGFIRWGLFYTREQAAHCLD